MTAVADWLMDMRLGGSQTGFYQTFEDHAVAFVDRGPKQLVVTFDNLAETGDTSLGRGPWAYEFYAARGASVLGIMARKGRWFRDAELIAYLQALSDGGFFAGFDRVMMTGNSMGAFAALAFAPLAPGCTVLAFSPQSTLDKTRVPWEERYSKAWGADWSLPFSDAAEGAKAAGPSWLIYDPNVAPDKAHTERITAPQITKIKAWFASHKSPVFLRRIDMMKQISEGAMNGTLTPETFWRLYRARRSTPWYRNSLVKNAAAKGHPKLAKLARARIVQMQEAEEVAEKNTRSKDVRRMRRMARLAAGGEAHPGAPPVVERWPHQAASGAMALIGMTREGDPHLERWLNWHGRFLDRSQITLLYSGAAPQRTGCNVMPAGPKPWAVASQLANHLTTEIGATAVLPTQAFLILDPTAGHDPFTFAMAEDARQVITPFPLELVQHRGAEDAPMSSNTGLLEQRSHYQINTGLLRPAIAKCPLQRDQEGRSTDYPHLNLSESLYLIDIAMADHDTACLAAAKAGKDASAISKRFDRIATQTPEMRDPYFNWAHNRTYSNWIDALAVASKTGDHAKVDPFHLSKRVFRLPETFTTLF